MEIQNQVNPNEIKYSYDLENTLMSRGFKEPMQSQVKHVKLPNEISENDMIISSLKKYIDLSKMPIYEDIKNLINLKASSLFNQTTLFENDILQIACLTKLIKNDRMSFVEIKLTYSPKLEGVELTLKVENIDEFRVEPKSITNIVFNKTIEQLFILDITSNLKITNFPILELFVTRNYLTNTIKLAVPFSINKNLQKPKLTDFFIQDYQRNVV